MDILLLGWATKETRSILACTKTMCGISCLYFFVQMWGGPSTLEWSVLFVLEICGLCSHIEKNISILNLLWKDREETSKIQNYINIYDKVALTLQNYAKQSFV